MRKLLINLQILLLFPIICPNLTGRPIKKTELWVTGTLTPRAMQELNSKGIVVRERVSEELLPQSSLKEN
jgi:hypothetical protein